jgi:hypothetical protein
MSFDPTTNPYTPVYSPNQSTRGDKEPLRGFVKVVCIFFIILGSLGVLFTIQGLLGMLILAFMNDKDQFNPMTIFPGAMAVAILVMIVNFAVSVTEIVAGIWGLQQKRKGARLIRNIAGFMVIFKFIETAYGCVVNYLSIGPAMEQATKQMQQQQQQQADSLDLGMVIQIAMVASIGIAILIGVIMFLFYLFSFLKFSKQETLAQFS